MTPENTRSDVTPMFTIDLVITQISGLNRETLEHWIFNQWVRPDRNGTTYVFHEIDVARVRLINELHNDMNVNDDALPIVLSLLDQLYDLRRRMRALGDAIHHTTTAEIRQTLVDHLNQSHPGREYVTATDAV